MHAGLLTAFLLLSFRRPRGTRGRHAVPGERHPRPRRPPAAAGAGNGRAPYYAVGGVSPISAQCRELLAALTPVLRVGLPDLRLYWGNRNWRPFVADTVRQMKADGVRRAVAFATSAYSSYSACRQYLDDIDHAVAAAGPGAPRIDKIRPYFNHPGFIEPFAASTERALASLPALVRDGARLVFTAHSIPAGMAVTSGSAGQGTAAPDAARRWPATRSSCGKRPGWSRNGCAAAPSATTWCSRAAAAPRACPGLSRTSTTTSKAWPRGSRSGPRHAAARRSAPQRSSWSTVGVRQRPHGGRARPGRGGSGDCGRARPAVRPGCRSQRYRAVRHHGGEGWWRSWPPVPRRCPSADARPAPLRGLAAFADGGARLSG